MAFDKLNRPEKTPVMRQDGGMLIPSAPCPCGHPVKLPGGPVRPYGSCCGRWHHGPEQGQAPDAQALMRSRYSAYTLDLLDYLLATWHPRTRPATLQPNEPGLKWLGLTVTAHEVQDADHATVAFVARSKLGGRAHRLQECSRFVREHGRWYYLDGDLAGDPR
jgi:SEC-C motif domain protein